MKDTIDPLYAAAAITAKLPGEIWGITTCFNPAGYANKYDHLSRFSAAVRRQGLKLLVVELALCGKQFVLPDDVGDRMIRLSSDTVLWHKERLLNIAVAALPPECDKVVWVDADLLFENLDWVGQTAFLLERYLLVQPFQYYLPMPQNMLAPPSDPGALPHIPSLVHARRSGDESYASTALPGGVWAARRSLLEKHGIYDRFILGGGDTAVGWAMYGLTERWLADGWFRLLLSAPMAEDLRAWSVGLFAEVQGNVAFTPGRVFHLWHGAVNQRRYVLRFMILRDADFDPKADLAYDARQCWRWNSEKPDLHRKVAEYFGSRKEEG